MLIGTNWAGYLAQFFLLVLLHHFRFVVMLELLCADHFCGHGLDKKGYFPLFVYQTYPYFYMV